CPPIPIRVARLGRGQPPINNLPPLQPLSDERKHPAPLGRHYPPAPFRQDRPRHDVAPPQDQLRDTHPRPILAVEATPARRELRLSACSRPSPRRSSGPCRARERWSSAARLSGPVTKLTKGRPITGQTLSSLA